MSNDTEPESNSRLKSALFYLVVIGLFVIEWFLFRHYFRKFIAPFFLTGWDQVGVYCRIYQLHFEIEKNGIGYLFTHPSWLGDKQAMKGLFVPVMGLLSTQIFGPLRLAVTSINFVLFVSGQLLLAFALKHRLNAPAAGMGLGLFLLSLTHYITCGGINDLRLDYPGMIVLGWTFFAVLNYLEKGGKRWFALTFVGLLLDVLTRSILIFYWNGTLAFFAAAMFIWQRSTPSVALKILCQRSWLILGQAIAVLSLFLLMFWQPFSKYYLVRVANGEAAQMASSYGVHGFPQTAAYNLSKFGEHFQLLFIAVTIVAVITWIISRRNNSAAVVHVPQSWNLANNPVYLLFGCLFLATIICISCFLPSPNHVGVLTIPFAFVLTLAVHTLISAKRHQILLTVFSSIILAAGVVKFAREMTHPSVSPSPPKDEANVVAWVNEILIKELKNRDISRVCFPLLDDGMNFGNLDLAWYETQKRPLPENYWPVIVVPFQNYSWSQLHDMLNASDFVVLPIKGPLRAPDYFATKGQIARKYLLQMHEVMNSSFAPSGVIQNTADDYVVGVYHKKQP